MIGPQRFSKIDDWEFKKYLGKGGFGEVSLWINTNTSQQIAIKKCTKNKQDLSEEVMEKLTERWTNEFQMMTKRINNDNIVRTIEINSEALVAEINKTNLSTLPIIIMEYCNSGDLRQQFSLPKNYCGLNQCDIRLILEALKNSVSYLHSLGITHRDLKPENIVLHNENNKKIYKLTDLGYAKDIKETIAASHVGTAGYFAPELITDLEYSQSVDYWSMGIIVFEIICGFRPFLPHSRLANSIKLIIEKNPNVIAITKDLKENIIEDTNLFDENYINQVLKNYLEEWLRSALIVNKKERGLIREKETGKNVLKIFTQIKEILSLKILIIFSLTTYEFLSYEVTNEATIKNLKKLIANDIKSEKKLYFIPTLVQSINEITDETKLIDLIFEYEDYNHQHSSNHIKPMLYVTEVCSKALDLNENTKISQTIKDNLYCKQNSNLKFYHIIDFCHKTLYYIEKENHLYCTFLDGLKDYAYYVNDLIVKYQDTIKKLSNEMYEIRGITNYHQKIIMIHKNKIQSTINGIDLTKQSPLESEEENSKLYTNISKLFDAFQRVEIRYKSVLRNSQNLTKHVLFSVIKDDYFEVDKIRSIFTIIKKSTKTNFTDKKIDELHTNISQSMTNCLKTRYLLLEDLKLQSLQKEISAITEQFLEIQNIIPKMFEKINEYNRDLVNLYEKDLVNSIKLLKFNSIQEYKGNLELKNNTFITQPICSSDSSIDFKNCNGDQSYATTDIQSLQSLFSYLNDTETEENSATSLIQESNEIKTELKKLLD